MGLAAELLTLQRSIGNAAWNALLQRQAVAEAEIDDRAAEAALHDVVRGRSPRGPARADPAADLQPLRRRRPRAAHRGPADEAFGGIEWKALDHATTLSRLKGAATPKGGAGGQHRFRYAELFKDGVLDLTFGLGYLEAADPAKEAEAASEMGTIAAEFVKTMQGRGYSEDKTVVERLMKQIGRPRGPERPAASSSRRTR